MQLLHNPGCSKSREALALLRTKTQTLEVIDYLKHPLTLAQLQHLRAQLGLAPREFMRSNEAAYAELNLQDESLSDTQLLQAIADHPRLLQRPILIVGERAVIGRPTEALLSLLP